jgi:hypothetical protein
LNHGQLIVGQSDISDDTITVVLIIGREAYIFAVKKPEGVIHQSAITKEWAAECPAAVTKCPTFEPGVANTTGTSEGVPISENLRAVCAFSELAVTTK